MAPRRKKGRGYSFRPSSEALADAAGMSAEEKLIWLKQANNFVSDFVPQKKLAIWERYKKGIKE